MTTSKTSRRAAQAPKAPKTRTLNPRPMAFTIDPTELGSEAGMLQVSVCRWTPEARQLLNALKTQLKDAPGSHLSLPIQDLRFRVQVRDKGVVRVETDLGAGYYDQPLLYSRSAPGEAEAEANAAVAVWATSVLSTQKLLAAGTRRQLEELALAGKAVTATLQRTPVFQWDVNRQSGSARNPRNRNLYADLAEYAGLLVEGQEIYPGAGPMRRVVTPTLTDNAVLLMTDPQTLTIAGKEVRFSLGIELSTETYPGRALPVLQVSHRKLVWAREPKRGSSRIGGYMFPAGETRALQFTLEKDLSLGEGYLTLASEYGLPPLTTDRIAASGTRPGWRGHQLVINHRHGRAESDAAFRGMPVLDQTLSFERLSEVLAPHGLRPWTAIQEVPTHFGQKTDADMDWKILFEDEGAEDSDSEDEKKADRRSAKTKAADRQKAETKFADWLVRVRSDILAHYDGAHHIVLGYGEGLREDAEAARTILMDVLSAPGTSGAPAAGQAIIELKALPLRVHGPRLPGDEARPTDRAVQRAQAWSTFTAEVQRYMDEQTEHPVRGVIVMADLWYQDALTGSPRKDDKINKRVGRVTLNRQLGVMVQYLLPRERIKGAGVNHKRARNFQIRTINAWRDLAWKSIGKMNGLSEKVALSFAVPPADRAELTLLGVGIIRVNKKRWSGNATSFIPYAIELDPLTGTCSGSLMLGQGDAEAKPTPMLPLPELVRLLNENGPSYLVRKRTAKDTNEARKALTQRFLQQVITQQATVHPGLIVLADAATLSGMWPWLADEQINPHNITLNDEPNAHMDFPDASFIRIRSDHAPKVLKDASDARVKIDGVVRPAAVWSDADLYRVTDTSEAMTTYLSFGSRIFKAKRGISSYRDTTDEHDTVTVPRNKAWITPNAIEITVVRPGQHDPEELAKFVEALRSEYAHFGSWINNPGPLHFASLLKDYVPDYELADEEDDEVEVQTLQPGLFD